jgi:hypothetical protein
MSIERLKELERGTDEAEALAFFDALETVRVDAILGRWRGSELPTGHPLDGLLTEFGWYGKEFIDPETAHPLLFQRRDGVIVTVDPRKLPIGLAGHVPRKAGAAGRAMLSILGPLVGTSEPRARLRQVEYRGKVSATMVYDHLPILDAFRRVDDATLLGAMDQRGVPRPFLFILRRG